MPNESNTLLVTAQPEAAAVALHEIQRLDPAARLITTLSPEARLLSLPGGYHALLSALQTNYLIFVRHMFPVHYAEPMTETAAIRAPMIERLLDALLPSTDALTAASLSISVQLRVEPRDDTLFTQGLTLAHALENALTTQGFCINDKSPDWVVSLFLYGSKPSKAKAVEIIEATETTKPMETMKAMLYAGFSSCADNRSPWNGGAVRYKKDSGYISRAEFKLLEAFAVFGYTPALNRMRALDLGAAPGGWTRTLLEQGFTVTAVDPAALHERLHGHPRLHHMRDIAQRFTPVSRDGACDAAAAFYDLIVNDMRMDTAASCRILLDAAAWLHPNGKVVMTFKLTPGQWYQKTKRALMLLEQKYRILDARQLFHNRDEVTVYAEPIPTHKPRTV